MVVVERALFGLSFLPRPPPPLPLAAVPLPLRGLPWLCGPHPRPDESGLPVLIVDPITELLMVVQLSEVVGCPPRFHSVVSGEENLPVNWVTVALRAVASDQSTLLSQEAGFLILLRTRRRSPNVYPCLCIRDSVVGGGAVTALYSVVGGRAVAALSSRRFSSVTR